MSTAAAQSRIRRGRVSVIACALAGLVLLAAASSDAGAAYSDKKLKRLLRGELIGLGLDPKNVSSCTKKSERLYVCRWRAKGVMEGEIPYECSGRAKFLARKKVWEIDPCDSIREPMLPLGPLQPHPLFGFNEDWNLHLNRLGDLPGTGAEVARQGLFWEAVERSPGNFDWNEFDNIYFQMLSRGIRPHWVLFAAPCWAQGGGQCQSGAHPAREYFDEFARFAALAAARYPEAIGIEVWNEPNFRIYWGGDPDASAYGEMFATVAPAIKAANPDMPVITGALSPHIHDEANAAAYAPFLRRVYETGAPQMADAIGAHPYPNRRFSEDYLGNIRVNLYRYVAVMRDFGDDGKPIWVTETGVSNQGEDESFSPEQQAIALGNMYDLFRRIAYPIPVVIFHRFLDKPNDPRIKEQGYGVMSSNGNRKPAYCAVAQANEVSC